MFCTVPRRRRTRQLSHLDWLELMVVVYILQGLWPNYIKVVPSIALAFTTYELLKEMMGAAVL